MKIDEKPIWFQTSMSQVGEKLTALLIQQGYKQSNSYSLFTINNVNCFTIILVYVDDIIVPGNSLKEFDRMNASLDKNFNIEDLELLKYFLG